MKNAEYTAICIVTGKKFQEPEAGQEIVETGMGPIWVQLWDNPDRIKFNKYGEGLIPRSFVKRYPALAEAPEEALEPKTKRVTLELVRTVQQRRQVRVSVPLSYDVSEEGGIQDLCEQVYETMPPGDDGWVNDFVGDPHEWGEPILGQSELVADEVGLLVECIVTDDETAEWVDG